MNEEQKSASSIVGLAVLGSLITGFVSIAAALFLFITSEFVGAGVCLTAAALSFGLLVNAILRK